MQLSLLALLVAASFTVVMGSTEVAVAEDCDFWCFMSHGHAAVAAGMQSFLELFISTGEVQVVTAAAMLPLLLQGATVFFGKVEDYMERLYTYWTKSFAQLLREAEAELENLDGRAKDLIRREQNYQKLCMEPATAADRSHCIANQMEVAKIIEEVRGKRREARYNYEHYLYKHESGSWF